MCVCVSACILSHVQLFATLWTVAHQAPLFMGFSRQKHWNGLPYPPTSFMSPALAGGFFTTSIIWEALCVCVCVCVCVCIYICVYIKKIWNFLSGSVVKNTPANVGDAETQVPSQVRKIPWRRKWQPTPVSLPGKSQVSVHGIQRPRHNLAAK